MLLLKVRFNDYLIFSPNNIIPAFRRFLAAVAADPRNENVNIPYSLAYLSLLIRNLRNYKIKGYYTLIFSVNRKRGGKLVRGKGKKG